MNENKKSSCTSQVHLVLNLTTSPLFQSCVWKSLNMPEPAVVSYTLELDFPEDIKEIALEQGEDPNVTCQLMQQLKDMVYEKGDCNPHRMDDDFLIKFLRARFWKVDNAYKLVSFWFSPEK